MNRAVAPVASPPASTAATSAALFDRARRVIPGGVNSPVRAFRSVGGTPYFVVSGDGAYVTDVEGNRLVDYVQSYGASILGHAHPRVVEAIASAARRGTTFGAPTAIEVEMAETITSRVPGCDCVRMVSSGTEATMTAIRVARGSTGRTRIVKFDGCYHGHADPLLAGAGSGIATLGLPDSAGVTPGAVSDTVVVPYNEVPDLAAPALDGTVAAVIVEPVAANMGLVAPAPGFLPGLRAACDAAGALLIFDEVITGFRVGPEGASALYGVRPDLWCFGKIIGGGLPVGAVGGRREVMGTLAPVGPVYQAGTLSGNPLALAAGMEVLTVLDERGGEGYAALSGYAQRLATGLAEAFSAAGVAASVPVVGPLVGIFFGEEPVTDFASAQRACGGGEYAHFFHSMLDQGIAFAPGAYEAIFPSHAHGEVELERTLQAAGVAARAVAGASGT